jgi:hypothetical protein
MAAALALLLLYLFTVEIPRGKEEAIAPAPSPLFSFSPETVTRLTLRKANGGEIVLTRSADSPDVAWRLTTPIDSAADPVAVASFLSDVIGLQPNKTVDAEPKAVKPYGLDSPAYTLLIAVDGVDQEVLDIGSENPNQTGRYARKGIGSPVWLISSDLIPSFERGQDEWRDRRLFGDFQGMEGRVEAIVIENVEGVTRLAKPEQAEQIAQILDQLLPLRVDTFLDDPGLLPTPGTTLRLLGKKDDVLGEMTIRALDEEKVQASTPAQPTPFLLRHSDIEPLLATLAPPK